jgi:hypothetical protein
MKLNWMYILTGLIILFVFFAFIKPLAEKTGSKVFKDYDPMKSRNI